MRYDKKAELLAAHQAEMKEPAEQEELPFQMLSQSQIKKAQLRYATLCAEYAACEGIYNSYRAAGLDDLAETFANGAVIARESAKAAAEMLDIFGVSCKKL